MKQLQTWGISILQKDIKKTANLPIDLIPKLYPTTTVIGGQYRGVLYDMQAKFNLNNLVNPKKRAGFINLLNIILPGKLDPKDLSNAISNWVSPAGEFPLKYDDAYKKAGLIYTAPHRFMLDISELRKVAGINQALYRLLTQYVTVLPRSGTALNINTAVTADLVTIGNNISLTTAKAIASARPYKTDADVINNLIIKNHNITKAVLTTVSDFFVVRSLVQLGDQQLLTNNYIYRDKSSKQTKLLWQTQGVS